MLLEKNNSIEFFANWITRRANDTLASYKNAADMHGFCFNKQMILNI